MNIEEKITSPLKAIRAKCIDCSIGSKQEVKLCPCSDCSLYAFRFGRNPHRKPRQLTEEQKAVNTARLRQYHKKPCASETPVN